MKPSELRELAQWHDAKARQCDEQVIMYFDLETTEFWLAESNRHIQSAIAMNLLADVLEARPVATCEKYDDGHFILAHDSGFWQPPAGEYQLIIKPTLGDDK